MRPMLVFVTVIALSTVARADNNRGTAVDARTLPRACAPLVWVPKDARTMTPTLEAYTSIAGCIVRERTRGMELRPNRNAVNDLELAIHPAIDLLDTVIEVGDPVHQIIALHAKADIYHGLTVMLDDTLRRSPGFGRSRDVERLTQEWRNNARDANRKVIAIAERDPYLVRRNPVLVAVVRDSRTDHAPGIATR